MELQTCRGGLGQPSARKGNARRVSLKSSPKIGVRSPTRRDTVAAAIDPASGLAHVHDALQQWDAISNHMLSLGYEPVVLPCHSMNCGDIVYRSSLDPVLRMEQRVTSPQGILLIASACTYLLSKPGVLQGMIDTYVAAPLQRINTPSYSLEDVKVGRKLAMGGFGTVYTGELPKKGNKQIILKKATEFGEAEVWMNERMMRANPDVAAKFITAFSEKADPLPGDPLWLLWDFEGTDTLADLMKSREFPQNMEKTLFQKPLSILPGPNRRAIAIRVAMSNLLEGLKACHSVGIVHRDIKPANFILASKDKRFKLIDFGAAADLRVGINYVPNQYLLDPRYAPPEQYIMSSQTPRAPPTPVAAFLSPVLWQLNGPDKFDMYSAGITLLQMAFAPLRSDGQLIAFNKTLGERYKWDLNAWRRCVYSFIHSRALALSLALSHSCFAFFLSHLASRISPQICGEEGRQGVCAVCRGLPDPRRPRRRRLGPRDAARHERSHR